MRFNETSIRWSQSGDEWKFTSSHGRQRPILYRHTGLYAEVSPNGTLRELGRFGQPSDVDGHVIAVSDGIVTDLCCGLQLHGPNGISGGISGYLRNGVSYRLLPSVGRYVVCRFDANGLERKTRLVDASFIHPIGNLLAACSETEACVFDAETMSELASCPGGEFRAGDGWLLVAYEGGAGEVWISRIPATESPKGPYASPFRDAAVVGKRMIVSSGDLITDTSGRWKDSCTGGVAVFSDDGHEFVAYPQAKTVVIRHVDSGTVVWRQQTPFMVDTVRVSDQGYYVFDRFNGGAAYYAAVHGLA